MALAAQLAALSNALVGIVLASLLTSAVVESELNGRESISWSAWSNASECSRSCGGGIAFQTRECLRSDGTCIGSNKLYSLCNTQDCPDNVQDFREEQCQKYNNVPYKGTLYDWVPYYGAREKCALNCAAKGTNFYVRQSAQVIDGTPCDKASSDICVNGVCQPIGCDLVLGSEKKFDNCRVCAGDGSSCYEVIGTLETSHLALGYTDVIMLPKGSTSISLQELNISKNYLAVRNAHGEYYFNGHWSLIGAWSGGRDKFTYSGKSVRAHSPETLSATGPTSEKLYISVVKHQVGSNSVPIKYKFFVPNEVQTPSDNTYFWYPEPWLPCSAECGVGYHARSVHCRSSLKVGYVSDQLCDPVNKPLSNETCMLKACPSFWHVEKWSTCSTTCGEGIRVRNVICQQQVTADIVTLANCSDPKPSMVESCGMGTVCPNSAWQVGEWSECNRKCGLGQQVRKVFCEISRTSGNMTTKEVLADEMCNMAMRPLSTQECILQPCDGLEWIASTWTPCSQSCDKLHESRSVACSSSTGKIYLDDRCAANKKPEEEQPCSTDYHCKPQARWLASQWTECSAQCGLGIQHHFVVCAIVDNHQLRRLPESNCNSSQKVADTRDCIGFNCGWRWFTGPFGKCTLKCGGGIKKRNVFCLSKDQAVDYSYCDPLVRPAAVESCNEQPCDDDSCRNSTFGCCRDGSTAALGENYLGCPPEDDTPLGSCITSEFGCCRDDVTFASGPYMDGCPALLCNETEYGCCDDGITAAKNLKKENCTSNINCDKTEFGCCSDGVTVANGPNYLGCITQTQPCNETQFGCCPDEKTPAKGLNKLGCDDESSGDVGDETINVPCNATKFGCCIDEVTAAKGLNGLGCDEESSGDFADEKLPAPCELAQFGCCHDNFTAAKGPNFMGCPLFAVTPQVDCKTSIFGCCPDNITAAEGADGHGCGQVHVPIISCNETTYGCCKDGIHVAHGQNGEGCPDLSGCLASIYGCCEDGETPAQGSGYLGCPTHDKIMTTASSIMNCSVSVFGCCPDGVTTATGEHHQGCEVEEADVECAETVFGCCLDGLSVAAGPNFAGCSEENVADVSSNCLYSKFGCCEDGLTAALGPLSSGCPVRTSKGDACGMVNERGSCHDYVVKWYFDVTYGDCTRFWYGGCDGNGNRFDSKEDCQQACDNPETIDVCYLPKSVGRCQNSQTKYYYNHRAQKCEEFIYGGCLGNKNNFDTLEECEHKCFVPQRPDLCSQPSLAGPCKGKFERWFYDAQSGECQTFTYGGCLGNDNRFLTADSCYDRCVERSSKTCQLPVEVGPCTNYVKAWYFDSETGSCQEFSFGGCHGNLNRFATKQECESICRDKLRNNKADVCTFPMDIGKCNGYYQSWYYDKSDGYCKQFVYGGCEGNLNRFETELSCRQRCNAKPPVDVCLLMAEQGNCHGDDLRYYYDNVLGKCLTFTYSGCEGNGNNFETIEECAKTCMKITSPDGPLKEKCLQPKEPGPCLKALNRWYFDSDEQKCMPFTYGGCEGNRNRFMTEELCNKECYVASTTTTTIMTDAPTTQPSIETTEPCKLRPIKHGSCPATSLQWYYNTKTRACLEIGPNECTNKLNGFETSADCEKKCIARDICILSQDTGPCRASLLRWFFNTKTSECEKFIYGGCRGNDNRFETKEDCEQRCSPIRVGLAVCALPNVPGPCDDGLSRWYYDTEKGGCEHFIYGGCNGNDNNFDSEAQCKETCPSSDICQLEADTGPCKAGKVRYYFNVASGDCEEFTYGGCQGNANRFLSIRNCRRACKRSDTESDGDVENADICQLPKIEGECDGYEVLWYFDTESQQCQQFAYTGCNGNANRFESFDSCEQACYRRSGDEQTPDEPDVEPDEPHVEPDEQPHVDQGHKPPLTVPHKSSVRVCQLDKDHGPCANWTIVWYFDSVSATCRRFYYGGCEGNGNRFENQEACEEICKKLPEEEEEEENIDAEKEGNVACLLPYDKGPCEGLIVRWYYSSQDGDCRDFLYGGCEGNANNFKSLDSCEANCRYFSKNKETTQCLEPRDVGPCHDIESRWYFDQTAGECQEFSYGGCEGNKNNFKTRESCEEICSSIGSGGVKGNEQTDVCLLTKDPGPCSDDELRFYYDSSTGECRPFSYRGCQGNANNFRNPEECYGYCGRGAEISRRIYSPGDCFVTKDAGSCSSNIPRWYFDASTADCHAFYYSGCGGNRNNFYAYDDCYALCSKATQTCGVFECDQQCQYGFELDTLGCQLCKCLDPCKNHECSDGETCHVETEQCNVEPCPLHAVCRPEEKEDTCGEFNCELTACYYGFKKDENGCDICACYNLCEEHSCPDDHYCVVEVSQCLYPPCPHQAICRSGCHKSEFGCCLDGLTAATGHNYLGCQEETPEIEAHPTDMVATDGDKLLIPCKVRASPPATISWFRNRYPVTQKLMESKNISQLADGSLLIATVSDDEDDDVTFTCRAYNGIGSATRTYSLRVNVPATIVDMPSEVTAVENSNVVIKCNAIGTPQPTIRWLRNDKIVESDGEKYTIMANNSLVILNMKEQDSGDYICKASNDIGRPAIRTVNLVFQGLLSVDIGFENRTYIVGESFALTCIVNGASVNEVQFEWSKNNVRLDTEYQSELYIKKTKLQDAGVYSCAARKGSQHVVASVRVNVRGTVLPPNCADRPYYANCQLIIEAHLCEHRYFKVFCCKSCFEAGMLTSQR